MESLKHWTYEREEELMDSRYKPKRGTGIMVRLWGGWEWETRDGRRYRTNGEGEGLWRWMEGAGEWKQIRGTAQFRLSEERAAAQRELFNARFDVV